ncbi:MAG: cytochrome c3 family protein [Magnetococcales bacterium]|nr:cytochrome c3 family protein [Magnetococcales bacterium]
MNTTIQSSSKLLKLSVVFGIAAVGLMLSSGSAIAGIKGSKHDLGSGGASQQGTTSATTEVCVFCHTPHSSNTAATAPLWNKSLPSSTYTRYSSINSTTIDGAETTVGSVSLACLSCHDGSQAMDVMINKPGSGGYTAGGANLDAGTAMTNPAGKTAMLGTDISNDHPISIQYGGGGWISGDTDGAAAITNLADKSFKPGVKDTLNSNPVWWIDTTGGTNNVRDKTDMILYTRTLSGVVQPFVECASCHDPHNSTAQPVSFLRMSNASSAVCLACHDK